MEGISDINGSRESFEGIHIPIEISYSVRSESLRIRKMINRYAWFKENGYKIRLPEDIKNHLENGENVSDDEIRSIVENEYQDDVYTTKADELKEAWDTESEYFLERLKTLGRPMVQEYTISLTRYGTGGSYGYPNLVQLNINNVNKSGVLHVTFHEMVHLAIQDLIEKYEIPHWTKERLVDLTMNAFFPDKKQLQRDPENAQEIDEIFESCFPDIEKIIADVSKIR